MEPKNIQGIRNWMTKHRPDLLSHLNQIIRSEVRNETYGQAALLLLTVGSAAGREYQQEHPNDLEIA